MTSRFVVQSRRGKGRLSATFYTVVDRKTGRAKGRTDTYRDGDAAKELAEIQARALNRAHHIRRPRKRK